MDRQEQPDNVTELQREHDEAMEVAEEARETEWTQPSYAKGLFMGEVDADLVLPYPEPSPDQIAEGEALLAKVEAFMRANVDPVAVERDKKIPPHVVQGLKDLGLFGLLCCRSTSFNGTPNAIRCFFKCPRSSSPSTGIRIPSKSRQKAIAWRAPNFTPTRRFALAVTPMEFNSIPKSPAT